MPERQARERKRQRVGSCVKARVERLDVGRRGGRSCLKGVPAAFSWARRRDDMPTIWEEIEKDCLQILSLPHNVVALKKDGKTPQAEAKKKVAEVRSGLGGAVRREDFR